MIDESEGRDVTTAHVVGAYLNADIYDFVGMKIEGMMVYFMVKVDPGKYSSNVCTYNNKKVLYVKIVKALYRCIKLGLL